MGVQLYASVCALLLRRIGQLRDPPKLSLGDPSREKDRLNVKPRLLYRMEPSLGSIHGAGVKLMGPRRVSENRFFDQFVSVLNQQYYSRLHKIDKVTEMVEYGCMRCMGSMKSKGKKRKGTGEEKRRANEHKNSCRLP